MAFSKYVDSMLDVLLPTAEVRDYLKQEEILFFGPDENTADFMDWCVYSTPRGCSSCSCSPVPRARYRIPTPLLVTLTLFAHGEDCIQCLLF